VIIVPGKDRLVTIGPDYFLLQALKGFGAFPIQHGQVAIEDAE